MPKQEKQSTKDMLKRWVGKPTRKHVDYIAWSTMSKMVDGLTESGLETQIDVNALREAIANQDVESLFKIRKSMEIQSYSSPSVLLRDRLIVECFKKYSFANSPFKKREKAKLRFYEAERLCRETNKRLKKEQSIEPSKTGDSFVWILNHIQRDIARCLGTFRSDEMLESSRFGPGATLCVKGPYTTPYYKLSCKSPTCGAGAFPYAEALLNYDRKWLAFLSGMNPLDVIGRYNLIRYEVAPELGITDQNKVTFVPKNAETERSIAIEPYFNLYFQLGIGGMIRRRLMKHFGIDLSSQERNQELAKKGSTDDSLATIDFSMASDTIAIETIRLLLEYAPDWFAHLDRLRSRDYILDGVRNTYQKFSSMGNGFTFELETLIFSAVARAVCAYHNVSIQNVSVYGDDVILPSQVAGHFIEVCTHLGFITNEDKSFTSGPFRESCGKDFLEGNLVRPVFCEELLTVADVASFSNRLLELNRSVVLCDWDHSWLDRICSYLREFIPKDIRKHLVGPPSEVMDTYIHVTDLVEMASSCFVRWNVDYQSWEYPSINFIPRVYKRRGPAMALFLNWNMKRKSTTQKVRWLIPDEVVPVEITGRKIGSYKFRYNPCVGLQGAVNLVLGKKP